MRIAAPLLLFATVLFSSSALGQSLVAETPALTAEEQRKRFHLPPGFEIQLVAQEPDIHKPMNMKFDDRGRLWVTHSLEYPYPAKDDATARDAISVLSDFAPEGRARKVERFADRLNIPIGVLPLAPGEALAWSIPNIYRLTDSNGDGTADKKAVAFGPFGVVDTHGNQNAFTRWIDGWVYANHGFSNDSHVKVAGQGEVAIHMNSGNTYRFRADGSAIEQYSWGQVNPFGLSFDPLGNLYSADCHSSAVSMLLPGGYYQSFGKPHDGLGYAPVMTNIDHGGTGIAGVAYSTSPEFPAQFCDVLFVGNVITNRVHCDRLKWFGSTPTVEKVEDFVTCDDPWFRPVDIQVGPDGALYIADFYNCVIGHYEVPLDHPKRDRERGRIWRVVYTGGRPSSEKDSVISATDLHSLTADKLFDQLRHSNLTVRVLATNRLVDAFPEEAARLAGEFLSTYASRAGHHDAELHGDSRQASHALWVLQRTTGVSEDLALALRSDDVPRDVRVHLVKALSESPSWLPWQFALVRTALGDRDAFVRRAAAEALARHPAAENLSPLLKLLDETDPRDAQLYHQVRIAIRNQIASPAIAESLADLAFTPSERSQLVSFAATAPSGPAAVLIFDEALNGGVRDQDLLRALPIAAKYVDPARIEAMITHLEQRFAASDANLFVALRALAEAQVERGFPVSANLRSRLARFIETVLANKSHLDWYNRPLDSHVETPSPWGREQRPADDGDGAEMISSLAEQGERGGGVLCSPAFEIPPRLSFRMCGHNGIPSGSDGERNYVRLVLEDGTEVARSYPPRSDIAKRYEWDLISHAGQRGHLEVVDGMTESDGFAWIAVSAFEPSVVSLPVESVGNEQDLRIELIRLAGDLKITSLKDHLVTLASSVNEALPTRLAATQALIEMDQLLALAPLKQLLDDFSSPIAARTAAAEQLGQIDQPEAQQALLKCLTTAPQSLATGIAVGLASKAASAEQLLKIVETGKVSPSLLLEPAVAERLRNSGLPKVKDRVASLTDGLESINAARAELIAAKRSAYLSKEFDPEKGRALFAKSICASCHRVGAVGSQIGPALDGIGNRGLDRLLEDVLDPNRNVDPAFRSTNILTDEGRVYSGFGLQEDGRQLVFNDAQGKQVRVPLEQILEQTPSSLSPMPTNVAEQLPEEDFFNLLAYLLSLRQE